MKRIPILCRIIHRWRHLKTERGSCAVYYEHCTRCGMHRVFVETGGRAWDMWSEPYWPEENPPTR